MKEIIEKRKEREKHFLKENGEIIAMIYDEDVHFSNNGKYEEIDNTLTEKNGYYANGNNAYKISFGTKTENYLMRMETSNHYINVRLKDSQNFKLEKETTESRMLDSINYCDVFKNIDISYKVMPTKVKECIILKNKDVDIDKLVFIVDTDLQLKSNEDRSISAIKDGETILTIDAPYMVDSNEKINNNVYYELKENDTKYLLQIVLDEDWLNDEKTKYPVTIDPTIINSGQNNSVYDTYIYPNDTNVDRNSREYLKVGVEKVNGRDVVNRSLIKFELPTIGTGSQVIDAWLDLRGYPDFKLSYEHDIINIHRVTEAWNETAATWNTMNDKYDSRIEGSFESSRDFYFLEDGSLVPGRNGAEITNLVKKWYSDLPNYGIMLKLNNEVYKTDIIPMFFSKNNTASGSNPKPILAVTYRNQNGLEDYMNYQTQAFSQGNAYSNNYNGNLTTIFDIGSTIGGKLPASLSLVYNTNDVVLGNNMGYGLGYRISMGQTIKEVSIDDTTYLEYTDGDGTIHYFLNQKAKFGNEGLVTTTYENTYFDEDGLDLTITNNENDYILKDKNNNTMKFIKSKGVGYLSEITDISNNKITVTYDANNKIIKIKDANEAEINLTYGNNIITIISPDQTVTLNYLNNNLISIDSLLGTTLFTYDVNNVITSIVDVTGKKIAYGYYDQVPYRLKRVSEYSALNTAGSFFDILYGFNSTTIVDSKNRAKTMTFNNYGNVVSISNLKAKEDVTNAYGMSQKYGEFFFGDNTYSNKLLRSEIPLKYVKNYLTNTSFESDIINFIPTNDASLSISDEASTTGFKSLKAINSNTNQVLTQSISVPKGSYYDFSAYVKNTDDIRISLSYTDENSNTVESMSEVITTNNDFERFDVAINYPKTAISDLNIKIYLDTVGTIYIDDIQLEAGEVANNYNLLENSDFSNGLAGWTLVSYKFGTDETVTTTDKFEVVNINGNTKALKVKMNPAYTTAFEQTFNVSGHGGDIYNISFWYKHEGFVGCQGIGGLSCNDVIIKFNYIDQSDGHGINSSTPFNPNDTEWQYFSYSFMAEKDFSSLNLEFNQQFNANNFYITNLNLFKDVRSVDYDYDENGNIILSNGLDNESNEFNYDTNNQLIKMTNPRGKNFTFEYDNVVTDRVLRGVSGTGISNEVKYDSLGNPTFTTITNRGQAETITEGIYKIRLKGTEKCLRLINNKVAIDIDGCGHDRWNLEKVIIDEIEYFKIKHSIIPNRYITALSNIIILTSGQGDNSLFTFTKNNNGSFLIRNKATNIYLINNNDSLVLSELEESKVNYEFYLESITNGEFIESSSEYTEDGKFLASTTDTNFNKTIYDIDNTTGLVNSVTNAKNQTTYYNYNTKKQIASVTSGNKVVTYDYNVKNLLSKISQDSREYAFNYDEFLNTSSIKIGDNITLITNTYEDNNGDLLSTTYGNNHIITFDYDEYNRIKTLTKMNDVYHYKYGNNGDLVKVISNNDMIKYTYDLAKRLYKYSFNDFQIKYGYDLNNNVINKKYQLDKIDRSINNIFNDDDAITKTTFDNAEINYVYDNLGRLNSSNINNVFNTNYEYVTNGKRTSLLVKNIENNNDKYSYRYDKLNNITHIYHNNILENKYYYDEYNELIKEDNYLANETIKYKYDSLGNILSKKVYELNTYNQLEENKYEYNNTNWKDQLTKFNNEAITYDTIGNPLTIGDNINLTWTNGRELNTYTDLNNTMNYKYNKDGIRISKEVNNVKTTYYIENNNIIFETTGNNMLYYLREVNGSLIGFKYNDTTYYYMKNAQDDIIGILDTNLEQIVTYKYDSWGQVVSVKDGEGVEIDDLNHIAHINPFRYQSYYYDKETQLYYLNSRYYNPKWGRYINADTELGINQDILAYNLYAYVSNNPINFSDPTGHWKLPNWAKIAIGVAAVAVGVVATAITGGAVIPAIVAGVKAITVAGAISATIKATTSVVKSVSSGSSVKETVSTAAKAAVDGLSDGVMAGGIVAGGSQIASAGFKIATQMGVAGGKGTGIQLSQNVKILSPDKLTPANIHNGGTLFKYGNTFRLDVSSNNLLHAYAFGINHIPVGSWGAGIYGGTR